MWMLVVYLIVGGVLLVVSGGFFVFAAVEVCDYNWDEPDAEHGFKWGFILLGLAPVWPLVAPVVTGWALWKFFKFMRRGFRIAFVTNR